MLCDGYSDAQRGELLNVGQEDINVERHWQYTIGTKSHVMMLLDPPAHHDDRYVPRCRLPAEMPQEVETGHVGEDMIDEHNRWSVLLRQAKSTIPSIRLHDREPRLV